MMAKISSGQGFAGLVDYANDIKDKNANIIASEGVDLTSNKSIVASFSLQAKSRPSLKNFVGHISLSFAPEDAPKLSDTLMADIAKEYLRRMGIVNTQFVMSRHHDKPHPHVHIAYNRVDNDGNAITGDQGFRKSARITQALTREYGLTFSKDKKKVNRDRLKGKAAVKYRIYDTVTEVLQTCRSMEALKAALAARGIGMNITLNAEGKPKGVVFTCSNISFGGYQIDRSMTYAKLCQSLGIIQDGTGNAKGLTASDGRTEQPGLSFGRQSSDTHSEAVGTADGMAATETTTNGGASSGGGIGEAVAELVMQPHVVQTGGGGGGGNDRDWNDEDKEKNKKNPYKRRR
ncbi:relaxase/mobilization nuclease domain-containing protein [Bacteroides heparinolyticus]|uniref:relaxase/mobilization nuclease domain-containing protein n=3 Tax=Prevotella heparinolytica TaxID=28113 RepID=UPI0035A0E44C